MSYNSKEQFLKKLMQASESVLEKDHPNPNRIGCPGHTVLKQLAEFSEGQVRVELDVIRHVAECFPCFHELRELRLSRTIPKKTN
jgi:hypothetical protein